MTSEEQAAFLKRVLDEPLSVNASEVSEGLKGLPDNERDHYMKWWAAHQAAEIFKDRKI